jgi:hypothetical protein
MNAASSVPINKLERRKLMTVAANIAAVARLENPFRLSGFGDRVLLRNKGLPEEENERKDNDRRKEEYNEQSIEEYGNRHFFN